MPEAIQIDPFQIAWFARWKATYRFARVGAFREEYGFPMYSATVPGHPWPTYSTWMMRQVDYGGDMETLLNFEQSDMIYWFENRPLSQPPIEWPDDAYFIKHWVDNIGVIYGITWTTAQTSWVGSSADWADHIPADLQQSLVPIEDAMSSAYPHPFDTINIVGAFELLSVEPDV